MGDPYLYGIVFDIRNPDLLPADLYRARKCQDIGVSCDAAQGDSVDSAHLYPAAFFRRQGVCGVPGRAGGGLHRGDDHGDPVLPAVPQAVGIRRIALADWRGCRSEPL